MVGIALAAVVISSVYAAGVFDSGPELPEVMEGEATFSSNDGEGEFFHVIIDYKRKLIQLTSVGYLPSSFPLSGRRLMSFEENDTANGTNINATKIVIQDYNTVRYTCFKNKANLLLKTHFMIKVNCCLKLLYFSKALFQGLIFGGAYLRREICVSKSIGLAL